MKLTNKQYLVDITLKQIQVKQTKQPSKITCQVHYGDNYLKMKLQPQVKNGVANFYEERIRIPYANDIALVFKMMKNNKKEVFLGHFPLQLEKYLKERDFFIQIKGENLEETDARVTFDCRIIDKANFQSQSDEIDQDEITSPQRMQTQASQHQPRFRRQQISVKQPRSLSCRQSPYVRFLKKPQNLDYLLNQEYFTQLQNMKQIMNKKQSFIDRHKLLDKYSRDEDGFLRSDKILELENRLLKLREQERVGSFLIYVLVAGVGFVMGFVNA